MLLWVGRLYQFQKWTGWSTSSSWTCSGHIKHVLLTYNYLLSHREVSLNQRIQQPLFKDYPKNITEIMQDRESHLRPSQEALQNEPHEYPSSTSLPSHSLKGRLSLDKGQTLPVEGCRQLSWPQLFLQRRSDYTPKTHPVVSSVPCRVSVQKYRVIKHQIMLMPRIFTYI